MDPPLRPAPRAQRESPCNPANSGRGAHRAEDERVVACAGQNHRGEDGESKGEQEVDEEEHEMEPEETSAGRDKTESVHALQPEGPAGPLPRLRDLRLRDAHGEEDANRTHEGDN